jgi:hypothetical protein
MIKVKALVSQSLKTVFITANQKFQHMSAEEMRQHWLDDFKRPTPHQGHCQNEMIPMLNASDYSVKVVGSCKIDRKEQNLARKEQILKYKSLGFTVLNKR